MSKNEWLSQKPEFDYAPGMAPFPRYRLVLVTENSGLEKVHIRQSPTVRALLLSAHERNPHIQWFLEYAQTVSHRYPESDEDRILAVTLSNLFAEITSLISDTYARDALLVSAVMSLHHGTMTQEDLLMAFDTTGHENDSYQPWNTEAENEFQSVPQVLHTEDEKHLISIFLKTAIDDTHPTPEIIEQREIAIKLRYLYQQLIENLVPHYARIFCLVSAALLVKAGEIFPKSFEKIDESYTSATQRSRGARMHQNDEQDTQEIEDDDDLSPYGTI